MVDMPNPDGVREVAGVWHDASGGFHGASSLAGSCAMSPEVFGTTYSAQMANVGQGIVNITTMLTGWGDRSSWYKRNFHGVVDAYQRISNDTGSDAGPAT